MSDDYLLGYVLEFSDGGPPEAQLIHRGTKASCESLAALLPAVAYSGPRPASGAYMRIVPAPAVDDPR